MLRAGSPTGPPNKFITTTWVLRSDCLNMNHLSLILAFSSLNEMNSKSSELRKQKQKSNIIKGLRIGHSTKNNKH